MFVWGGCAVTLLRSGLATTFTFTSLWISIIFFFSVALDSFLTWGLVLG